MEMVIKKWGNSLAARIPTAIAKSLKIDVDQKVKIEAKEGKIVLTPIKEQEYNLDDPLKGCPKKAIKLDDADREWLDADPVGKEIW